MQKQPNDQLRAARVQEQAATGLGIPARCVCVGFTASAFHYWRKRHAMFSQPATTFIALPSDGGRSEWALEVYVAMGHRDVSNSIPELAMVVAAKLMHDPVGRHWTAFAIGGETS